MLAEAQSSAAPLNASPPSAGVPSAEVQNAGVRRWDKEAGSQLLDYVDHVDRQGLVAADFAPEALRLAIRNGDAALIEQAATRTFAILARNLARGHVPPGKRGRYFIASDPVEPATVADLIDGALARRDVGGTLDRLAPQDAQYRKLQAALARLPAGAAAERQALRVNLERLRWLPRELGANRLVVNIPEYTVHLFQNGQETASYRVIVGKISTPTPRFSAQVTGVILTPVWRVPRSIIAESVGKLVSTQPRTARARGYVWTRSGGALQVSQQPGPQNSLGQIKLDMPNPLSVYLHDTPGKALFEKGQRTFSHGCVRTDRLIDLAAILLEGTGVDRAAIDRSREGRTTLRLPLARPLPIYVVYQTAVADANGTIRYLADPYRLDAAIAAQLDDAASPLQAAVATITECSPA